MRSCQNHQVLTISFVALFSLPLFMWNKGTVEIDNSRARSIRLSCVCALNHHVHHLNRTKMCNNPYIFAAVISRDFVNQFSIGDRCGSMGKIWFLSSVCNSKKFITGIYGNYPVIELINCTFGALFQQKYNTHFRAQVQSTSKKTFKFYVIPSDVIRTCAFARSHLINRFLNIDSQRDWTHFYWAVSVSIPKSQIHIHLFAQWCM